ncbi:MAG: hypothetical protein H6546_00745 [Chitinophagales bacterium]|nr:hypothetical protein [Chitinophagales bacterium]
MKYIYLFAFSLLNSVNSPNSEYLVCEKILDLEAIMINEIPAIATIDQITESFGNPDTVLQYSFSNYKFWSYSSSKIQWMQIDSTLFKLSYVYLEEDGYKITIIDDGNKYKIESNIKSSELTNLLGNLDYNYYTLVSMDSLSNYEETFFVEAEYRKIKSQLRFTFINSSISYISIPFP